MDDLIRRSDAIASWRKHQPYMATFGMWRHKEDLEENIPAVDAVEVRHAEWVASSTEHTFSDGTKARWNIWKCSRCPCVRTAGWEYTAEGQKPKARYCESCGARMDGQRREDGDGDG